MKNLLNILTNNGEAVKLLTAGNIISIIAFLVLIAEQGTASDFAFALSKLIALAIIIYNIKFNKQTN